MTKKPLRLFATGFAMGSADVVPGVSGGTMALLLGVYQELLQAISAVTKPATWQLLKTGQWKAAWTQIHGTFLLCIGGGILVAVATLSHLLEYLLEHRPSLVLAFFFGLVAASILVIIRRIPRWSLPLVATMVGAAVLAHLLMTVSWGDTPTDWWFLIFSGAIAICAMILPGVSGSYLLLLLGKYEFILQAVTEFNWQVLALVGIGAVVGLLSFARLISVVLKHHHDATMAFLVGCMIGTIQAVWPWSAFAPGYSEASGTIFLLIAVGAALVLLIEQPWRTQTS